MLISLSGIGTFYDALFLGSGILIFSTESEFFFFFSIFLMIKLASFGLQSNIFKCKLLYLCVLDFSVLFFFFFVLQLCWIQALFFWNQLFLAFWWRLLGLFSPFVILLIFWIRYFKMVLYWMPVQICNTMTWSWNISQTSVSFKIVVPASKHSHGLFTIYNFSLRRQYTIVQDKRIYYVPMFTVQTYLFVSRTVLVPPENPGEYLRNQKFDKLFFQ